MRCLEKQRDRRYETVGGLARDLECYLAHEPVSARPPGRWYLARKFARRHRGLVSAAAVVLLALSGGVVGTSVGLARAEAARAAEAAQHRQAQAREAETAAVLKFLEDRVLAAGRPEGLDGGLGADIRLMDAVRAALPHVGPSFAGQPLIEARLRATLGRSFLVLGDALAAEQQYAVARSLYTERLGPDHPDTLASAAGLAQSYQALGRRQEALRLNEETLATREVRLGPDHPDTLTSMNNLAISHDALRHFHEAFQLREQTLSSRRARLGPDHPDTLQSMHALGVSYTRLGRHREALELAEKTLALRRATLGPDHPQTLRSLHQVANGYQATGRRQEAVKLQEEVLARQRAKVGPDHPDTHQTMHALSRVYATLDRYPEAIELCETTLALQRKKLGPDHPSTLLSMRTLALQYTAVGRHTDAHRLNAEAWAARKATLGPDHPYTLQTAWRYADSLVRLGRGAEAVPVIDDCYRRAPGQPVDPRLLPEVLWLRLRHFAGRMDAAGCRATADMWERLGPADAEDCFTAAVMRAAASGLYAAARHPDEAKADADRAASWLTKAVAAGFRDRARLETEADLAAVRGREDFRKLLESLPPTPPRATDAVKN
jgi:tetratricopeptide (TPR) repeat protein